MAEKIPVRPIKKVVNISRLLWLGFIIAPLLTPPLLANSFAIQIKQTTARYDSVPPPPKTQAKAYILMDVKSGKILAEKYSNKQLPPASLTKLMTLDLTFQALKNGNIHINDQVIISKKAWRTGGSKMFIKAGDHVSVKSLISGVIVDSGNDASIALAQYVGGSINGFVSMMNNQAQYLGMNNSDFINPTGLPAKGHLSSAKDLAKLSCDIINNYPKEYKYFATKWFSYNNIRQSNRNRLLWHYANTDGLKTGYTKKAGYCLVASALKNNTRLLVITLGEPSNEARTEDSIALLRYGFHFYGGKRIYNKDKAIYHARVWEGHHKTVAVGVLKDVYITVKHSQLTTIQTTIYEKELQAPVTKGQLAGKLVITVAGKPFLSQPLYALREDAKGNLWQRSCDIVIKKLDHWFHKSQTHVTLKSNNSNLSK